MGKDTEIRPTESQQALDNAEKVDGTVVLRSKMSANADLAKYLDANVVTSRSEEARGAVGRLVEAVCAESASANTWWALLHHEECYFERSGVNIKDYVKRSSTSDVILFDLYDWATRLVPQKGNKTKPAFVNIWLGHARQQWLRGQDDALDAIKALKTQQIGLSYAPMYIEWASIEAASDNVGKALSVVAKGIREQAQPIGHLKQLERNLKDGTFSYRPFWTFSVDESAPLTVDQPLGVPSSSTKVSVASLGLELESKTPGFVRESMNSISDRRSSGSSSRGSSEEDVTTSNTTMTVNNANVNVNAISSAHKLREGLPSIHQTPGANAGRQPTLHHGTSNAANMSKLATPLSASSLSARRSRIAYNKVTNSCEKLAKSLREDLTCHRPPVLHAIPENNVDSDKLAVSASLPRKPLVIGEHNEDTACLECETVPLGYGHGNSHVPSTFPVLPPPLPVPASTTATAIVMNETMPHRTPIPGAKAVADGVMPAPSARAPPPQNASSRKIVENEQMVIVRDIQYTKLECVGKGGSSKVYKVMAPNKKIFALKRIRLNGKDQEAATGFLDEITLLARLKGKSNIIQLIDSEVHKREGIIYMVLECGDIDLAKLLQRHEAALQQRRSGSDGNKSATKPSTTEHFVDENFVRMYWEQMLHAVDTIHRERIVHSDLKPANFLVVEGQLKLIDFGIAKAIQADTTSIARESQVGTLNYMSPEAITGGTPATPSGGVGTKVGRASDIWSLGCILYQMVYGKTPFAHLPFIQKMHAIIDEKHEIAFPPISNPCLLDVIKRCLHRHPKERITMKELLDHPFLHPEHANGRAKANTNVNSNSIELSKEQLRTLLQKVATSGADADVNTLSDMLFLQLVGSNTVGVEEKENPRNLPGKSLKVPGPIEDTNKPKRQPLGDFNL